MNSEFEELKKELEELRFRCSVQGALVVFLAQVSDISNAKIRQGLDFVDRILTQGFPPGQQRN